MKEEKFSVRKRLRSFKYAVNGIKLLFVKEHNARIHGIAAVVVITAGFFFEIDRYEWIAIVSAIGIVFITETLNTAIEHISDYISPSRNEKIRIIKDLAAATVLFSAIVAVIIGILVFGVRLVDFFC